VAVNYYDGQGFMVKKDLGVSSAKELDGATVCIQTGTTTELNLADFFKRTTSATAGDRGRRQRSTAPVSRRRLRRLHHRRLGPGRQPRDLPDADNHIILPEIISKEPLGPVVRHGDNNWGDVVRWTYYALLVAEEKGITSANVERVGASTAEPRSQALLGVSGDMGAMMGLDNDGSSAPLPPSATMARSSPRNIGEGTPINLARGLNALWTQGGLQYAPPFR
jgi:general L-amino acid transport system substrate-binding protein